MLEREEEFFFKTNGVIFEKALINKSYADYSYYGYCGLSEKFIEIPENKHLIIIVQGVNRQTALHIFDQNTINFIKKIKLPHKFFPCYLNECFYVRSLDQFYFIRGYSLYSMTRDYKNIVFVKKLTECSSYLDELNGRFFMCHDVTNENTYIYDGLRNEIITFKRKQVEESKKFKR